MSEKRCKTCGFWKILKQFPKDFGDCSSDDAQDDTYTAHYTRPTFGCIHWQRHEPDLREQLAEYIDSMVSHYTPSGNLEWGKERGPRVADEIIAMFFEKWQKGKGDV